MSQQDDKTELDLIVLDDEPVGALAAADRAALAAAIALGTDILVLAAGLLQLCRERLPTLLAADADTATWRERDRLSRRYQAFFAEVADEELDASERVALEELAEVGCARLPAVVVARLIAEALDAALGPRFLPMHLGKRTAVTAATPLPTPHPDWRELTPTPSSDPWALDGRLDALPYLRLAGDWAEHLAVTLDGDWRTWHLVPQLRAGDTLACAVPNEALDEILLGKEIVEGRPVFGDVRPRDERAQLDRCTALLELARERACRVVVFPELSTTKAIVEAMRLWLAAQEIVELIVAGSCHRRTRDGRYRNEATILMRGLERPLRHRKFRPYGFVDGDAGKRYELLAAGAPGFTVWLSPHWALTCLICKDLVQEPVPHALVELRANLVLVPAMSFKMDAFHSAAADLATWAQGITLIANSAVSQRPRGQRPPAVIGLPSQYGSVAAEAPPPRSLWTVTLGSNKKKPAFATVASDPTAPRP